MVLDIFRVKIQGCRVLPVLLFLLSAVLSFQPCQAQDTAPGEAVPAKEKVISSEVQPVANEEALSVSQGTVADTSPKPIGIDERIDALFRPIADIWGSIVFFSTPQTESIPAIPVVVIVLVVCASYFTVYFGFVNLRQFMFSIKIVLGKYDKIENVGNPVEEKAGSTVEHQGEVSHFQALATAVSGTVGLGNIAGVAVAIAIGGPGATFWMIVCGLLGMSTKFVECTLGVCYRDIEPNGTVHGGPMYYLSKGLAGLGFKSAGRVLGILFAILCIGASLGGGNMFQANQCTKQIQTMIGVGGGDTLLSQSSGFIIGTVLAIIVAVVIIGGIKRIASVTDKLVPLMAIIYVVSGLIIVAMNISYLPAAISQIISGAFSPLATVGGVVGVIVTGFRRAAFSNEAGAGSASIAHSAVHTRYPASEGIVALLEPFIDTVVICTMTAVIIVLFNMQGEFVYGQVTDGQVLLTKTNELVAGVDLTSRAFDATLPNFRYVLTLAVILFAFSTMISWSYYGLTAWKYLFGKSKIADVSYKVMFCCFVVVGSASSLQAVIDFSDAMILAMVFPNMVGLVLLAPRVKKELIAYLKITGQSK